MVFSWILRNCRIVDGSGATEYKADLAIDGKKIAGIGSFPEEDGRNVVDAKGLVCAPGFIDCHSHSDLDAMINPREENKLAQGVTTEIAGNCGFSLFPVTDAGRPAIDKLIASFGKEISIPWKTSTEFFALMEKRRIGFNYFPLAGHGMLKLNAMGFDPSPAGDAALAAMKDLLEVEMRAGCRGISTGLEYAPGSFSRTEELIALAETAAAYGGIYTSHLRNQSDRLLESVEEAITIGREAGIPVIVSHLKAYGAANWGTAARALELIEKARGEGLEVMADFYPYEASSTTLLHELPRWALAGEPADVLARLDDRETRRKIRDDMVAAGEIRWDKVIVGKVRTEANASCVGSTVEDLARERKCDPFDAAFDLLIEETGGVEAICELMSADDVDQIARSSFTAVGSDAYARNIEEPYSGHPRDFGTFPRFFQRFVREKKLLTLEEAVRKTSGMAAEFLGISDRGRIGEGLAADLVLFDPESIGHAGTFLEPGIAPEGVAAVFVNGELAFDSLGGGRNFHRATSAGEILRNDKQE